MQLNKFKKNTPVSQSFIKGAMVLSFGMILVKACGLLQKVLLTNLYSTLGESFGEFGSGIFANAYELYVPLFALATAGFPVALSRTVSVYFAKGRYADVHRTFRISVPLFVIMGSVCFLLMILVGFWYSDFIDSPYSLLSIVMLAPTVLFGCLVAVYRGYFEGLRNMTPTAVSEIIEAITKIFIGVSLSYVVINLGAEEYTNFGTVFSLRFSTQNEAMTTLVSFSVAASIVGITLGGVLSFLYIAILYKLRKNHIPIKNVSQPPAKDQEIFTFMLRCALPVGVGSLVMSIAGSVNAGFINRVLKSMVVSHPDELSLLYPDLKNEIFNTGTAHTCIWGYYCSCLTVLSIVLSFAQVFSTAAMPNVANAYVKGDKRALKSSVESVLRFTSVFSVPAGIGICILAEPVLRLVYFSNPNIVRYGTQILQILGFASVFMGLSAPVYSMLQGIGKAKITMCLNVLSTLFKVLLSNIFASVIRMNISGVAVAALITDFLTCLTSVFLLCKHTKIRIDFTAVFLKPLVSAVICGISAFVCYYVFDVKVIFSIVISAIIYLVFLFILHTFSRQEIKMLLNSKKIVIILEKLHIIG